MTLTLELKMKAHLEVFSLVLVLMVQLVLTKTLLRLSVTKLTTTLKDTLYMTQRNLEVLQSLTFVLVKTRLDQFI